MNLTSCMGAMSTNEADYYPSGESFDWYNPVDWWRNAEYQVAVGTANVPTSWSELGQDVAEDVVVPVYNAGKEIVTEAYNAGKQVADDAVNEALSATLKVAVGLTALWAMTRVVKAHT